MRQHCKFDTSPAKLDGVEAAEDQLDNSGKGFVVMPSIENDPDGNPIPFWKTNPSEFDDFWMGYHSVLKEDKDEVAAINLATVAEFFKEFPHLSLRD